MQYVMLTVQTINAAAVRFYERQGYTPAPHSPNLEDPEEAQVPGSCLSVAPRGGGGGARGTGTWQGAATGGGGGGRGMMVHC
jgi:hypothetical protein